MAHCMAARCTQCSGWIRVGQFDADAPTIDPTFVLRLSCPHCGAQSELPASSLEMIPESKLQTGAAGTT